MVCKALLKISIFPQTVAKQRQKHTKSVQYAHKRELEKSELYTKSMITSRHACASYNSFVKLFPTFFDTP